MEKIFIPLLLMGLVGFRILAHFLDKKNILQAAEAKGWQEVTITWAPFAPGWFFEKGERHYEVSYLDQDGRGRSVYCKTSLLTGIYWRDPD